MATSSIPESHNRVFDPAGLAFGVVLPLLAAFVGPVLTELWRDRLPDRIATHWSSSGPDHFAAPMAAAWQFTVVQIFVGVGLCAFAALAPAMLLMRRMMLILGLTVTGILLYLQIVILTVQRDRTDSHVHLPWTAIPVGAVLGAVVGLLAATRLRDHRRRETATERPAANLLRQPSAGPVRDVVGFGRAGTVGFVTVTVGAAIVGCVAARTAWPLAALLPVLLILAGLMRFDVAASPSGVTVRNLGMTSVDIGIEEIEGAVVVEANPFKEWGGWGLRVQRPSRYGIVTRTGPAVRITTASGLSLTVTTDRADTMAGALNVWADQSRN